MDQLREALRQVQVGVKSFEPDSSTIDAINAFQPLAAALKHANDLGYFSAAFRRSKMIGTHGCILQVIVTTPLSYEGAKFLQTAASANENERSRDADIFQLKPSVWGVSIDLKALYRKWVSRARK